jgi:hypothetical protein
MHLNKNRSSLWLALVLFSVSCSGPIDRALDCSSICNRFEECFDSDFDSQSCAEDCRNNAQEDQDFADQADACESCIDERACTENFSCVDECFGIVP